MAGSMVAPHGVQTTTRRWALFGVAMMMVTLFAASGAAAAAEQEQARRSLQQYVAPQCTLCISMRRASGVSPQQCQQMAGRLLSGLRSYFAYTGYTCQLTNGSKVATVCTTTAGPRSSVQQYLSDLKGSLDLKAVAKDLGLACLTQQTSDYLTLSSPCLGQDTQVKVTPSTCTTRQVPPPSPTSVGASSCRVCASVFRLSGGFSNTACSQLASLLSLPVFVGSTNPTVPSGQALPFQCVFVNSGPTYSTASVPGFPSYGIPTTVGSNAGTLMTACADFPAPANADAYLTNLQNVGGPAGLTDMLGLTCSMTHMDALSATSTCSSTVASLYPSTCICDEAPPPPPLPPSSSPPLPPSLSPPPPPSPTASPPWYFNAPPPPWWLPSPPPSPAAPTCRVCIAMTRPHDFVNGDGAQQLADVMNAATKLFYLRVKLAQPFQVSGAPDAAKGVVCGTATTKQDAQLILQQLSPSYDQAYSSRVQSALGLACGQYRMPNGVMSYEGLEAGSDCGVVGWTASPPSFCTGSGSGVGSTYKP